MNFDTAFQTQIFFICVFLGACAGLLFSLNKNLPLKNKWVAAAFDVIFSATAFAVVWFGLLNLCFGIMRWYCFAGILLGFFAFKRCVGEVIDICFAKMYNTLTLLKAKRSQNENIQK